MKSTNRADTTTLSELALLFLKLGTIAFGGPAAHIAMMEDEVVRRRKWLTREKFLDLLGATNLIPGPNSTEMAIHVGYLRAGWPGLLVALLHLSRSHNRVRLCLGLRHAWVAARDRAVTLWGEAGDHRDRSTGALGTRAHRSKHQIVRRRRIRRNGLGVPAS